MSLETTKSGSTSGEFNSQTLVGQDSGQLALDLPTLFTIKSRNLPTVDGEPQRIVFCDSDGCYTRGDDNSPVRMSESFENAVPVPVNFLQHGPEAMELAKTAIDVDNRLRQTTPAEPQNNLQTSGTPGLESPA